MLQGELTKIGLSEKEANVYLAAIQLGPSSVQKIARRAKVNRATTYVIIESLIEMGLMSTSVEGKKARYTAEKPERLVEYFENKEREIGSRVAKLRELLPEIALLYNDFTDKPKVRYFEGIEGLKAVYKEFNESQQKGDIIYTFLPMDEFYGSVLNYRLEAIRKMRVEKGIRFKVIYTSKHGRNLAYESSKERYLIDCRYVDFKDYPFSGGMNVYGNKVFMIDYKGQIGGLVIENKTIAGLIRTIFEMAWRGAGSAK